MKKMTHSRLRPHGSKLWANEIMRGAPLFQDMLEEHMSKGAKFMEEKIRQWVEEKRINPVEHSSAHKQAFTELIALETRRRTLEQISAGAD